MKLGILISTLLILTSCTEKTKLEQISESMRRTPEIEILIEGQMKKGFFIGMEPYFIKSDYQDEESFYQILKAYFSYAKKEEVIATDRTVVVLPEYLGTWLVASGEKASLFEKETINEAMRELALNHLGRFIWVYLFEKSYATDRLKETLFRMKAWQMAETYQNVFSRLASDYRVDIVAGSIILPEPKVVEGKITVTEGPLQNVSFYFHSDGTIDPKITRKHFLIEDEKVFVSKENKLNNPSYKTPFGILYIMICADSWYPAAYKNAIENSADLLAVPSFVSPIESWDEKWHGYNGHPTPLDVTQNDLNQLTERQAWKKYSMIGRAGKYELSDGINVFFNGKIWDLEAGGTAFIMKKGKQIVVKRRLDKKIGGIYALGI